MGAGTISKAADILEEMIRDKNCKVFLGLAGAMVPGGMKKIIVDMLREHWIDVFLTTGANLTHDLIEAIGFHHYQGTAEVSDIELNNSGINRIYDSYLHNDVYPPLGDFLNSITNNLPRKMTIKEFWFELGRVVKDKESILRTCADEKIPVFCPAMENCGIASIIHSTLKKDGIFVDACADLADLFKIAESAKKKGSFVIGGGVPKDQIMQALQFTKGGASYAIQITMDRPEPGGSSGAPPIEAISWGKMRKDVKCVNVISDSTIALPIIVAAVKERLSNERNR